eukprot:scaffold8318_cov175-Amphora_coffeaeformis.AAC.3
MGGGLTDWHRQKRKKEQKKNKEKRLAERDARVLETKTASSVQEEIRKLERQHKVKKDDDGNDIPLPHTVQSKLDRLKKEFKILKDAEGDKKDNNLSVTKNAAAAAQSAWKPLDNPQLSIYYDAVMNPFGEPPPGQPRLYHTAGGRKTFNLADAALPGSRPPPPLPPPPRKDPPSQQRRPPPNRPQQQQRSAPRKEERPPAKKESTLKGNNNQQTTIKEKSALEHASKAPATKTSTPEQAPRAPPKPRVAPDLPAPSQAVKRGRSRLKADIWASTEEIDYHQHTDDPQAHLTLEGVEAAGGKDEPVKEWWYEDQQKQTQGPFPHQQMIAWIQAGYFPAETRARPGPDAPWKPFHHYPVIRAVLNGGKEEKAQKDEKEMSVQDRIASLRKEHKKTSIADRIAALRGDGPKPDSQDPETGHDDNVALPPPPPPAEEEDGTLEMPAYPVVDDAYGVVDDDALPPPPPSPPPEGGPTFEPAPYAIDEAENRALPLPPPPPPAFGGEKDEIPAYAIRDASAYDETTDYPPAYPTEDYSGDSPYPVDDTPVTDAYPVVDAYPMMDVSDADAKPPLKKKAKVDREPTWRSVRALHLNRSENNKAKPSETTITSSASSTMIGFLHFLLLVGGMLWLSSADESPTLSPSVQDIKSDYPSIVPPIWPESTSPPSPGPLHDDDAFESHSVVLSLSTFPSLSPSTSAFPSNQPSSVPSDKPSSVPSDYPSAIPSDFPSSVPSDNPSTVPSDHPSSVPSDYPSALPSDIPSAVPTSYPSYNPSSTPSSLPSDVPSVVFEALGGFVIADAPEQIVTRPPTVEVDSLPEVPPSGKGKKSKMRRTATSYEPNKFSKVVRLLRKRIIG